MNGFHWHEFLQGIWLGVVIGGGLVATVVSGRLLQRARQDAYDLSLTGAKHCARDRANGLETGGAR